MKKSNKIFLTSLIVLGLLFVVSCGEDTPPVNPYPAPAPAPTTPVVPLPPPPPTVGPAGCALVPGGVLPLRPDGSFIGNLTPYNFQGGSEANTLTLDFYFKDHYYADNTKHTIFGTGMFYFPDIQMLVPQIPGQPTLTKNFCITSVDPMTGITSPGVFASIDSSIAIVLKGYVAMPQYTYSPWNNGGYPGQNFPNYPQVQGTMSEGFEVSIGNTPGCNAWLNDGRIYGCVKVKAGGSSGYYNYTMIYESR